MYIHVYIHTVLCSKYLVTLLHVFSNVLSQYLTNIALEIEISSSSF
jgi:hypothetical protein